jgi:agmatine deiminase
MQHVSRRRFLQSSAIGVASGLGPASAFAQSSGGHRIPGEFEPTRAIWISYDPGYTAFTVALVKALMPAVAIKAITSSADHQNALRKLLQDHAVDVKRIQFFVDPKAFFFLRDSAVFSVGPAGSLGVVDFRWTHYGLPTWCARRHAGEPDAERFCAAPAKRSSNDLDLALAKLVRAKVIRSALALEGGSVEVNGQGLMIVNRAVLKQRNPELSTVATEKLLLQLPGVRKVIWLPEGLAEDPHLRSTIVGPYVGWGTGGHTDEFVRFVDPSTVLLAWPDDALAAKHPVANLNLQRMAQCEAILKASTTAQGKPLRVIRVPMATPIERKVVLSEDADPLWSDQWTARFFRPEERRQEGDTMIQVAAASYMNFIIANDVVVVPDYSAYGTPRPVQERVKQVLESSMPGRRVKFVDAIALNWFGGGPHCATLKEPA